LTRPASGNSGNRSSRSGIRIAKSSGTLIAREALERKSGARGLLAIMESIMVNLM
jgi:ATP-dependent protease Clp ATPase subunit